jgi:uncharacterized protein
VSGARLKETMMTDSPHALARRFFKALSAGSLPDDLLTGDMTAWTTSSGVTSDRARYQGGVKMLAGLFAGSLVYSVDSLTAEADRVAAEVHADGVFHDGELFANRYVFVLRIRDGKIASVAEHFNPAIVFEKIVPRLNAVLAARKD